MDAIRAESLPAGRFQKFSEGRTSGEAALTAHSEERKAVRVRGANRYLNFIYRTFLKPVSAAAEAGFLTL